MGKAGLSVGVLIEFMVRLQCIFFYYITSKMAYKSEIYVEHMKGSSIKQRYDFQANIQKITWKLDVSRIFANSQKSVGDGLSLFTTLLAVFCYILIKPSYFWQYYL